MPARSKIAVDYLVAGPMAGPRARNVVMTEKGRVDLDLESAAEAPTLHEFGPYLLPASPADLARR